MRTAKKSTADPGDVKPSWKYLGIACLSCVMLASFFILFFLAQLTHSLKTNVPLEPGLKQTLLFLAIALLIVGALGISLFLWMSVARNYYITRKRTSDMTSYAAAIVESSEDAVIGNTLTGIITSWNKGAERLYGYTAEEMIGCPIQLLVPIHQLAQVQIILRKLTNGESVKPFEAKRIRKDGILIDVSMSVSPVLDASGIVVGTSMIARDITQKKLIEQQQEAQSRAIEQTNQQLARREKIMRSLMEDLRESKKQLELQKRSLEEANEKLKSMNKIKDDFVATASHELRTPLTAIREGISLIHDRVLGPINAEQFEFLNIIDESIDRLSELVSTILDLSKIEAGRLRLIRRRVSMADMIRSVVENSKLKSEKRNIRVELREVPEVFVDPNRISQVLWNLFSNALKFTEEYGVVKFSLTHTGDQVAVSVEDNGVGIAKSDLDKLFKKFSQVGDQFPRGTGLGLALSKEIVELHGGSIEVVSEVNRGSRFTFTLPVYSFRSAAEQCFKDQLEAAQHMNHNSVIVMVMNPLQAAEWFAPGKKIEAKFIEEATEVVRKHMYSADTVLAADHGRVVIMAAAEPQTADTIRRRLCQAFTSWFSAPVDDERFFKCFGTALYSENGEDANELIEYATRELIQTIGVGHE